jgi:hypothetical protein
MRFKFGELLGTGGDLLGAEMSVVIFTSFYSDKMLAALYLECRKA